MSKQDEHDLEGFRGWQWSYSYKSSSARPDGRATDILHDFYIPALRRAVRYDRVAGYFRSSSLAAASQGFSAFASADGRMRLIVGADLKQEDVDAILKGDEERLTENLDQQLGEKKSWPENVQNGVELLTLPPETSPG